MADGSKIEWTDATWNPITGCSVVSPGCTNCYAMRLAGTRMKHHPSRAGLTQASKAGPVWNGQVRLNEGWLTQPLQWSRPRMVFVVAHGDLFHESVPDAWIDRVFAVMALCPRHTFQVLTKRAERMRQYINHIPNTEDGLWPAALDVTGNADAARKMPDTWPLPNVWLGVSVEDQIRADERIPTLAVTPATIRFLSLEPLLDRIDLSVWLDQRSYYFDHGNEYPEGHRPERSIIDWVIAGGESGPHARPMLPSWIRFVRDQCHRARVKFFFKQWGEWGPDTSRAWPIDAEPMERWGKKRSGRKLDGFEHNGFPA